MKGDPKLHNRLKVIAQGVKHNLIACGMTRMGKQHRVQILTILGKNFARFNNWPEDIFRVFLLFHLPPKCFIYTIWCAFSTRTPISLVHPDPSIAVFHRFRLYAATGNVKDLSTAKRLQGSLARMVVILNAAVVS